MPWAHTIRRRRYVGTRTLVDASSLVFPRPAQHPISLRPSPLPSFLSSPKTASQNQQISHAPIAPRASAPRDGGKGRDTGNGRAPSAPSYTIACPLLATTTHYPHPCLHAPHKTQDPQDTCTRTTIPVSSARFPVPISTFHSTPFDGSVHARPGRHRPLPGSRPLPLQGRAWDSQQNPRPRPPAATIGSASSHPLAAPAPTSTGSKRLQATHA
ncbi:hypothetical protein B0H14DRAFT_3520411 [Mycena olivaceomarginata]|nr:hypothetical protein B0H14DRAFT_3520411 [Mycena olivaceomarginata]